MASPKCQLEHFNIRFSIMSNNKATDYKGKLVESQFLSILELVAIERDSGNRKRWRSTDSNIERN